MDRHRLFWRRARWRITAWFYGIFLFFVQLPFASAVEDGNDFTNNLFSDLAPILTLFGEQVPYSVCQHPRALKALANPQPGFQAVYGGFNHMGKQHHLCNGAIGHHDCHRGHSKDRWPFAATIHSRPGERE